ncbi:MAG: sensor histidine kinase [Candidatus Sericytochromatia bacterium]
MSFLPVICSGTDLPDSIRQHLADLDIPFLELPLSQLLTENTKNPLILMTCLTASADFDFWQAWKVARPEGWLLGVVPSNLEEQAITWLEAGFLDDFLLGPDPALPALKKSLVLGSQVLKGTGKPPLPGLDPGTVLPGVVHEVYHRMKNNLQVISSLLSLQVRRTQELPTLNVLRETQNRVLTMALAHEKLYQSQQLEKLNLAEYAQDLSQHLFHNYGLGLSAIQLKYDCEALHLGVDAAISCGLILNELISNAIKYAFPATFVSLSSEIWVRIRIQKAGLFELSVADNGVGLPPQVDLFNPDSLGLRLVNSLSRQLGGQILVDEQVGTSIRLLLPYSEDVL